MQKTKRTRGGGRQTLSHRYMGDYLLFRVQQSDDDTTALTVSASLASDHVCSFGPGETGVTPILAPKKSTDWDSTIDALGFTINSHTMRILLTREKAESKCYWSITGPRRDAKARDFSLWRGSCGTSHT